MSKLRIKLDFCNNSPLVWTFCDLKTTKTVKDLTKEIEKKHECKKVQLMLEDAILPPQEPIGLLENGDIIKIVKFKKRKRKISSSSSSSASENEIPVSATKNGVKKEKKNVKNEATESDDDGDKSDNETYEQPFKRSKLEVKGKFIQKPVQIEPKESLQTNIENEITKDKKRKRKRKNKNKNKLNLSDLKIICFGDSNLKRHQDLLHHGILSESMFILTYRFDELKESLFEIGQSGCEIGEEDFVIIHVMTNDVKYICHDQSWKSDSEKKDDLISLAHNFVNTIKQLIVEEYPDLKIIISTVLPRFDGKDLLEIFSNGKKMILKGNEIINDELSKLLLEVENVILVKYDDIEEMDFVDDKFHLSKGGFEKMCKKWRTAIEKEVEGIPTVLPLENNLSPASTPKALYSLPNHGKRTVFNDSSDSDKESKSLNISNGNGQKLESEDMSEKTATVDENNVSMDVSSPIVNGKTKKLAPNQKSISCEDFLLEAENCEKPNLKLKPKTNGFNALLSLADNPIKAKRIAQKDVYSSKSVVLTNTNDKNLEFGDIDQYPALEDNPNEGQTLAFKCLQIGPDYTPQLTQYVGELKNFDQSTKCGKFLVLFDENEGKSRLNKFEIDEVIEGQTKRNQEIEFSFSFMQDVKLIKNST